MLRIRVLFVAALAAFVMLSPAHAQVPGAEAEMLVVTRSSLESLLVRLDETAASSAFSGDVRSRARQQAVIVRRRLADGDFRVGDRVLLMVEGETALTDTFNVLTGRQLLLPGIGIVPMEGVLRSELTEHMTRALSAYLREPRVRAQALIKVVVSGAVPMQGFYTVPVDALVDDVFRLAGGMSTGDMHKIRIQRADETLFEGREVLALVSMGRTLDQLNIQAGDRFDIKPQRIQQSMLQNLQTITYLITLPFTIYGIFQAVQN